MSKQKKNFILNFRNLKHSPFAPTIVLLGLILSLSFGWVTASSAQGSSPFIWQVQVLDSDKTGLSHPMGMAFSSRANAFQVSEGTAPAEMTELVKLTSLADRAGEARIAAAVQNPINIAFDNVIGRLLILRGSGNQLWEVREDADGNLDPRTLTRHNIRDLNLQDPQGMTVDANGNIFILDTIGPRIVRLQPGENGDLETATFSEVPLSLASPRGIAFDATTGNLHVIVPAEQKLYELTEGGEVVNVRDLSEFNLKNPQGLVFAPSGDQTDDPAQLSLFVADSADAQNTGQIVELSLVVPASLPSGTTLLPASVVRTFDTSVWNNPSPDPMGIDYWPAIGRFLISDSEIEERVDGNPPAYWRGYNVFISSLSGNLVGNCTTYTSGSVSLVYNNFSKEPTGIAINEANNHIFFSDDDAHKIFEVSLGADGAYCTADDIVTSISTSNFGSGDSEDVAYGNNTLFVAGGTDGEVYQFSLGANGVLGGGDDGPVTHWDTAALGFHDLEGIDYNPATGTLFIVSTRGSENYLGEFSTSGQLLRAYSLAFMGTTGNMRSAVTYAPSSQNQAAKSIYIASRQVDNNTNRLENDGKVWEINISNTLPPTPTPGPVTDFIFADGFESGNLSAWTSNVTDGGDLSVSSAAAIVGGKGLQAVIDDNNAIYVTDDTPNAERRYRARFYFDPNSISMVSGDTHNIFYAYSGTSTGVVRCGFRFSGGVYQVRGSVINDSGTWLNTNWFTISDASHSIEIDWRAATAAGTNDGSLTLWVDGLQKANLTGVDNDTRRIDRAVLGPKSGLDSGTRGTYYFDAFESRRQTYIGP